MPQHRSAPAMHALNFNHLRCFWAVAKQGSVRGACGTLGLTQPTISKQVGDLEDALGEQLFDRTGRRLVLTNLGRVVYAYADDIFTMGQELLNAVRGQSTGRPLTLHVGVSDVVPKLLTRAVLEPTLTLDQPVRLVCHEGKTERLLADLAMSGLDVVLTDAPLPPGSRIRAFNHTLLESPIGVYGKPPLTAGLRERFPRSLDGAPVILPTDSSVLRRSIDRWLQDSNVHPRIIAEIEDSALTKSFAEAGHGLFFAPTVVGEQIGTQIGARLLAEVPGLTETLYAVTVERRVTHPAVTAIIEHATRHDPRAIPPEGLEPSTR